MWVYDDETLNFLRVNAAACVRYGYTEQELLAITPLELRSPEEQEVFKIRMEHPDRVWEHRSKSGDTFYVREYDFPFEIESRPTTLSMIADVTEEVRLGREKTELLQRYQVLTEAANDLLWDWDLKTNMVTHNEALMTLYGYSKEDLVRPINWWSNMIHPDDFGIAAWSIQEAIRERRRYWTAEYRLKRADGSYVLVLDRGILHTDENDEPLRMVGSIVDLTTRKAAEDDRNQLFRLSIDCMLFLEPRGVITQANAAFYNLIGTAQESDKIRNMRDFLSPEDQITFNEAVQSALEQGKEGHFTTGLATESSHGETIHWGLITNESKSRLFLVGRNVTESIADRQNLKAALAEAQAARQAQSEFLQNMSHELRTPMNGMLGTAQMLAESATTETDRKLANVLIKSGESLLEIVNDILDISKIESGILHFEQIPFYLPEVANTVYDLFSPSASQKDLTFTITMSPEAEVTVLGDPFRLRQILSNLVGNAIKFTDRGAIALILDAERYEDGTIEAILKVRDTGIGIAEDMQSKVFDRFVQVDPSLTRRQGGTGLGLAISQNLAQMMGGSLSLSSRFGSGSDFTVRIPYKTAPKPPTSEIFPHEIAHCSKPGTKVLIAEDVEVNAMILTAWLEERGFECTTVSNGSEAIHRLTQESFDGAFLDLHMPDASGYDVVNVLRSSEDSANRNVPVVAVTASVSESERKKCAEYGFDDFIPKPILIGDLDRVVHKLF
jgi:PAS domain S-box-containing protein